MKPFELTEAPLEGTNLIEASAGTGKTYTIEGLYLRLVLERGLAPERILVVTFTQAATDELKDRVYRKLVAARRAFGGGPAGDDIVDRLVAGHPDPEGGASLIQEAVGGFDLAAIFTIHGFCQRLLNENAFETGSLFDTELLEDQSLLSRQVARDFWRTHLFGEPPEVVAHVTGRLKGPDALPSLLLGAGDHDLLILPPLEEKPPLPHLAAFRRAVHELGDRWRHERAAVCAALMDPALNGTIYGSTRPTGASGGVSPRELRVAALAAEMDALAAAGVPLPPLFKRFDRFTTATLNRATRRRQTTPAHGFFRLCDAVQAAAEALAGELAAYLVWFKRRALENLRRELPRRKRDLNLLHYDDLLLDVLKALEGTGGEALAAAVRRRYGAALVDEFQDTDRVQYAIFARLFAGQASPLFLIGDPKQAIYGFRGADIFTYMQAAQRCPQRYTLRRNWRSSAGLVAAVNAIFSAARSPFVYEAIGFVPAESAAPAQAEGPPLTIWYLDSREHGEGGRPVPKGTAEPLVVRSLAAEIARLLSEPGWETSAGDIAVLVRTNRQARMVKDGLAIQGIPAVLHSAGSIFETPEAEELAAVIGGVAEPTNPRAIKAALATRMWGRSAAEIAALEADPGAWQELQRRLWEYHRIWRRDGFMHMFRQLKAREHLAVNLVRLPEGERRVTNLNHLAEVLHRAAVESNLAMPALVKWLAARRDDRSPHLEAHQLRLESDADAVKIVTVHKSKGLEYPIVFCPFHWEASRTRGDELRFHHPHHEYRPALHLAASEAVDCRHWAQRELLAENLRLLYVALTRARRRCYLVWGRIREAGTSALAYLLHAGDRISGPDTEDELVDRLGELVEPMSDEDRLRDLAALAQRHRDCLEVIPLPLEPASAPAPETTVERPACRRFCGRIERSRSIFSYSTLASQSPADFDVPDYDLPAGAWPAAAAAGGTETPADGDPASGTIGFPRGPRAGIFFHEVLEQMSYDAGAREAREQLVAAKLATYGFDPAWRAPVTETLQQLLENDLPETCPPARFSQLAPEQRRHEVEFYFPLKPLSPEGLAQLLRRHLRGPGTAIDPRRIEELVISPAQGFMKGYIDMVFEHRGRYYLVDWKSNHLGDTADAYRSARLQPVMDQHLYGLQALIYTLALDRMLRQRVAGYDYETHFGGAFYVFLRGMRAEWGPGHGIHFARPEAETVTILAEALMAK